MKWLLLLFGILSNTAASVLIKVAVHPPRRFPSLKEPMEALLNWPFWLGLGLYGAAFLLYAAALHRIPLNVAQPILTGGAVGLVALASVIIFGEPFPWTTGLGIVLIIGGVALVSLRIL